MVITLTPEIEQALNEQAKKQGTTIELLALKTLRERLFIPNPTQISRKPKKQQKPKTLADLLTGYISVIDSSEFARGGAQMSKNSGKRFADILLEKQRR